MATIYDNLVERWEAFPVQIPEGRPIHCTKKIDLCVVYVIANLDNKSYLYLDALCLSLLSNLNFTDLQDADVKVFVSESLLDLAHEKLKLFEIEIISYSDSDILCDYGILNHDAIKNYSKAVFIDADVYFFGSKINLYHKISNMNIEHLSMAPEPVLDFNKLFKNNKNLTNANHPQQYIESFTKGLQISNYKFTKLIDTIPFAHYGFFWIANISSFRNSDWITYAKSCLKIRNRATETVLSIYANKHNWNIRNWIFDLSDDCILSVGLMVQELFRGPLPNGWLFITHPHCKFGTHKNVISNIIKSQEKNLTKPKKYKRVIKNVIDKKGMTLGLFFPDDISSPKIICIGCSFSHFRIGLAQYLCSEFPMASVWNMAWSGASTFLFAELASEISKHNPHVVVLSLMSPTRSPDKTQKTTYLFHSQIGGSAEKRLQTWYKYCRVPDDFRSLSLKMQESGLSGKLNIELFKNNEQRDLIQLRSKLNAPLIVLVNKFGYPYYDYYDEMMEIVRPILRDNDVLLETSFQGEEYSTLGPFERDTCWHPSALRLYEEAKLVAHVIQTSFPLE